MSGKKVEMYSLPYSSIVSWSTENARGLFDFSGELHLWTKAGPIKVKLGKGVDIRRLDSIIANRVLL